MVNDIYLIGEVGYEITLESVINQVDNSDKKEPLNVHIHSGGGSVYDGLAIYNYLKNLPQEVNTISSGLVASIASIIFLAGNKETRKINNTDSFLIHLPSGMDWGNADDLEKTAKELRNIEGKLAKIYANETILTEDEAMDLMKKDEMMDVNFLKEKGFVSKIVEFKAVANFKNNPKNKQMENKEFSKEDKNWLTTMFAKFGKSQITNKIVQDAQGVEIDFYDLEDTDTIKVGDKAKIDGNDANESYLMPDDKGTYVFVNGELTEIQEVAAGGEDDTEALKQQIADLKEQLQASATQTEDIQATVKEKETLIASMTSDMEEIKAKVTSSFAWDGKQEKPNPDAKVTRTMRKKDK